MCLWNKAYLKNWSTSSKWSVYQDRKMLQASTIPHSHRLQDSSHKVPCWTSRCAPSSRCPSWCEGPQLSPFSQLVALKDALSMIYQFPTLAGEAISHGDAVRELPSVPGEVLLPVGVLDVEPHHVHRYVVLVKLSVNCSHISLVVVVPPRKRWLLGRTIREKQQSPALVVGDGKLRRQWCVSSQSSILPEDGIMSCVSNFKRPHSLTLTRLLALVQA